MLKAVSRQILEVNNTDNRYFEKAWLVVKPEYSCIGADSIENEAHSYLTAIRPPYNLKHRRLSVNTLLNTIISALIGSIITACCLHHGLF